MGPQDYPLPCFQFLGYIQKWNSRSEIAESDGNSAFSSLRNCHPILHSSCLISYSHEQCNRVPVSPDPCQHLFSGICFVFDSNHPDRCVVLDHNFDLRNHCQIYSLCAPHFLLTCFSGNLAQAWPLESYPSSWSRGCVPD